MDNRGTLFLKEGFAVENYEINSETLLLIPIDKNSTKVIERENQFVVNYPVIKIIDNSCEYFGSSYQGRLQGTKNMLGVTHKAPIIIEESREIVFFPTCSPRLDNCVWISLNNLKDYKKYGTKTKLLFDTIDFIVSVSYGIINNQVLRATRLSVILSSRIKNDKKATIF